MAASSINNLMDHFELLKLEGPEHVPATYEEVMGLVEESGLSRKAIYKLKELPPDRFLEVYGKYVYKFRAVRRCNTLNAVSYSGLLKFLRKEVLAMMTAFSEKYIEIGKGSKILSKKKDYIFDLVPENFALEFHKAYGEELLKKSKEMSGPGFLFAQREKLYVNILNDCRRKGWFNRMRGTGKIKMLPGAGSGDFLITMELRLFCIAINYNYVIRKLSETGTFEMSKREWRHRQRRRINKMDIQSEFHNMLSIIEAEERMLVLA